MTKDRWEGWIQDNLAGDRIEPADDGFYHGVWIRIRTAKPESRALINPLFSVGAACWRAVPAFAALLLIIAAYGWFYPPDLGGRIATADESYVLDANAAPSNTELFYRIMHTARDSETETEP
jgi:hypothetical protein